MLTTKNRAQIWFVFSLAALLVGSQTGCAPAGARALKKGEELIQEGKYSEAVKQFEEATTALPNNPKAWNHLGLGYQYAGDPKKAVQAYRQALTLDRNLTAARLNLGSLYAEQRDFPAAIAELTTFVQLEPKNPDGWLKLGSVQTQLALASAGSEKTRQLEAAKRSLDYSEQLQASPETLNAIGMVQIQRGRYREAIPNFTEALKLQPDYAPALLNLAVVYHQYTGDRRSALENYRKFLSAAKQAPEVAQVQATVRQLENELNPRPALTAPTPAPTTATPARTPVAVTPAPIAAPKAEVSVTKSVPATKPAPTPAPAISSPKASQTVQRKPAPVEKPEAVEVATLPDEPPPVKAARDVPTASVTPPVATISNTPLEPVNPVRATEPAKTTGTLSKLNPVSWFKKKPKATTPVTDLPKTQPSISATQVPVEAVVKPVETQPVFPRFKYRPLSRPRDGDRAEAEPFFTKGVQAQKDRRLADALEAYRQALKADPAYFEANYNMALASRDAGDLSASLVAYEKALAIMPESVNARYNFAFTLQEAGYFQDAANELEKLLGQNPNETRAHLLLGNLAATRLNRPILAREQYLKVLDEQPQHPQATQIRYWLAGHP